MENTLYYGDNLEILREPDYFKDESVDLVYLDPHQAPASRKMSLEVDDICRRHGAIAQWW